MLIHDDARAALIAARRPPAAALDAVLSALAGRFGDRFSRNRSVLDQHGHTRTQIRLEAPDGVVFPNTTAEVAEIVRLCAGHRVPVIPYGTGTSLEGHVNAPFGGISIDTARMDRVLAVHAEDLDCVVEPGVTRKALNAHLRHHGLFFPVDPGADASLGGMVATRASGTGAVRYGTMKDNVLALEIVTPQGEVMQTARRAKKSSAGYDLTRLMVGSEGTLGVITGITLKLSGLPEATAAGVCPFPSVKAACDATILTIQSGIPVARIELLDEAQVRASNTYSRLGLPEVPTLFVEFTGSPASVAEQVESFGAIAGELGGGPFDWATQPEDRSRLWQARHDAYWASLTLRPGAQIISTDLCVPISRLADCVTETQADIADSGLVAPIVGHVGDGNFHLGVLFDDTDAGEMARVEAFLDRLVRRALRMEGTCTGEHGVGQGKAGYLKDEHPPAALAMMAAVKRAIDPLDIMNPGKILPMG